MRVAVDISLYPLDADFIPPIRDVIKRLSSYGDLEVVRNSMSTQLYGEYDVVMSALSREIKATFDAVPKAVFAVKFLNNPIAD